MPIIKSARKRMRQTEKRHELNLATKKTYRTSIKKFVATLEGKDTAKISEALREAQSAIDVAVKKNVMYKNTAARKKSALSAKAKAAGAKTPVAPKKATAKTVAKPATKATAKPTAKKAPAKKPTAKKA